MAISIRPGKIEDIAFIDALQKAHHKLLGFMPRAQLEGKIKAGHVLVAEAGAKDEGGRMRDEAQRRASGASSFSPHPSSFPPLGYVIGNDQYFKRDDCGIIYQLCVSPGQRRGLIGAALVKAMFDRSAYGCRLFCCWCAQDIEANHFWESLGFGPLAFRAGSRTKGKGRTPRVHIFWQKRIREGDTTTPYWFPSQTTGGSIREDRLVLPIPPDTHWSEAKPLILPKDESERASGNEPRASASGSGFTPEPLPHGRGSLQTTRGSSEAKRAKVRTPATTPKPSDPLAHLSPAQRRKLPANITAGLRLMVAQPASVGRAEKPKRTVRKNDPKYVAAARELRDRYLEALERDPLILLPQGKYDAVRALPDLATHPVQIMPQPKALPQAA